MRKAFWLASGLLVWSGVALNAAESFSRSLPREEFAAAGLSKLSPEELAKLDGLVRRFQSGQPEAGKLPAAANTAEARSADGIGGGTPKVILKPGTQVEYATVVTELVGPFAGFQVGTVFELANGQRWQVTSGSYSTRPMPEVRTVTIEPGALGSFFLRFEGVRSRPRVRLLGGK